MFTSAMLSVSVFFTDLVVSDRFAMAEMEIVGHGRLRLIRRAAAARMIDSGVNSITGRRWDGVKTASERLQYNSSARMMQPGTRRATVRKNAAEEGKCCNFHRRCSNFSRQERRSIRRGGHAAQGSWVRCYGARVPCGTDRRRRRIVVATRVASRERFAQRDARLEGLRSLLMDPHADGVRFRSRTQRERGGVEPARAFVHLTSLRMFATVGESKQRALL